MLGQKGGTDGEALPAENLPEIYFPWILQAYFHHRDAVSAEVSLRAGVLSPLASDPGASATSPDCYDDGNVKQSEISPI